MSEPRKQMLRALMDEVAPELRRRGFCGKFPHFKRSTKRGIHLFAVQFRREGGAFVAEIAVAPLNGIKFKTGWQIPPREVTVGHASRRLRLGAMRQGSDHWFHFETQLGAPSDHYVSVARSVLPYLDSQAEQWWSEAEKDFAP